MLAKTYSFGISGIEPYLVTIEVDSGKGLPGTVMVGLPDSAVKESRERVRSAVRNSGYEYRARRTTISLSPADIKKEGPAFDLAIALGYLCATEQIPVYDLQNFVFLGELALDGTLRPVRGVLPILLSIPKNKFSGVIIPSANAEEGHGANSTPVYPVRNLMETVGILTSPRERLPVFHPPASVPPFVSTSNGDFSDIKGQQSVKRGLEITAAGGHNCLMIGPPGSGKSMLAKRLPTILPPLSAEESLETTRIHSIMGLLPSGTSLLQERPFRAPHHTCSDVALVGGGTIPKPGEISLSHNGVLFLDELPEFNRNALEVLRQPLEDRRVTIARASRTVTLPANFMLIASMNPCPCGFLTDSRRKCHCTAQQIQRYLGRISGPLLDRIDIHLDVPRLPPGELLRTTTAERSADIRLRVGKARAVQTKRFQGKPIFANAQMGPEEIKKFCQMDAAAQQLLRSAIEELGFSARAYDKILKVSRTIADLEGSEQLKTEHLAEAIQYRSLDREFFP